MKILMVAPEVVPFVKVGGLADAVGSLSRALASRGHDIRVVLPKYKSISDFKDIHFIDKYLLKIQLGKEVAVASIWESSFPGSTAKVYFIEYNMFFGDGSVYCGPSGSEKDNGYRFALFSRAALDLCGQINWLPDIIHCHDWTTGLIPAYLNTNDFSKPLGRAASIMTIHNLQHQGYCDKEVLDYAGIIQTLFRQDGFESFGQVNLLKGGLYHTTKINTVSPSYAKEIRGEALGCGLNLVTEFRSSDLFGIINGIDVEEWNPENDTYIASNFSEKDLSGKQNCKNEILSICDLDNNKDAPLFIIISRLYEQKGLDLFLNIIDGLMNESNMQIAILGTGEAEIEEEFVHFSKRYPKRFSTQLKFDNVLAHKMIAGGDFILMPSRFEPCGLSQMYAMRYGTVPVVRRTGGLIDSVSVFSNDWSKGCGFNFENVDSNELFAIILEACAYYSKQNFKYKKMQINGMQEDFSWLNSAKKYESLYASAIDARRNAFL